MQEPYPLCAARRRVARFGPHKTTMAEIAMDTGCSRTALYSHFASKERLYEALLEAEAGRFRQELERIAASDDSARRKLRAIAAAALGVRCSR